ncbi:MAG: class I SAM-dependent methyltransferase [Clostridiales bacterium]|jgi:hypothetical protein|nr:class I SAM-dependent methyltransferase [Clostridiales bacterium]
MLDKTVMDALDGKGLIDSIYAEFYFPPIDRIKIRPNLIYSLCAEKNVIHLGCTDHPQLIDRRIDAGIYPHRQLTYVAAKCLGVDINAEAAAHVQKRGIDNVLVADITRPGISEIEVADWDWLVMADVLEHIGNPVLFLMKIGECYGKNIRGIIITVPNALAYSLNQLLTDGKEVVNYDHCYWFTPYTLCKVVHTAGLIIDDVQMCSYENPPDAIRKNIDTFKQRPILLNTIALTAHWAEPAL